MLNSDKKVVIAFCGKYLDESSIESIFMELETFDDDVVTSIMACENYIREKRRISLISISDLQTLFRTENRTTESINSAWKCSQN